MQQVFSSEIDLSLGVLINFSLPDLAQLGVRCPAMNHDRTEAVYQQPSTVRLVSPPFQTPTPIVGNGIRVETFRGRTPNFADTDGGLAEASKELGEVHST